VKGSPDATLRHPWARGGSEAAFVTAGTAGKKGGACDSAIIQAREKRGFGL
jgi:hypothetical protein